MHQLAATARALVTDGKGILAADESLPTIQKAVLRPEHCFDRRDPRHIANCCSPPGASRNTSAASSCSMKRCGRERRRRRLCRALTRKGILPGHQGGQGHRCHAPFSGEKITQGLDGLRERLREYAALGARSRNGGLSSPSAGTCRPGRASATTRTAWLSLPHSPRKRDWCRLSNLKCSWTAITIIGRCEEVTSRTLSAVFDALREHGVLLEGMLLKPNMVLSGKEACPPGDRLRSC